MPKKSSNSRRLKPFLVRWTNDDIEARLPERFDEALRLCGGERAPKVRALIRHWVREVEKRGTDVSIRGAIDRALVEEPCEPKHGDYSLNEPPAKYSGKAKKKGTK